MEVYVSERVSPPPSLENRPARARLEIRLDRAESRIAKPLGKRNLFRHG